MKPLARIKLINLLLFSAALLLLSLLTGCGEFQSAPTPQPAVIEESVGGVELVEREFAPCTDDEPIDENVFEHRQFRVGDSSYAAQQQRLLESQMPHQFDSLNAIFPLRGSWRQSKAEIMDIVDRHLYSPELSRPVPMLHYYDMVLLVNVAARFDSSPESASAQRMQVWVRKGSTSNNLRDWHRAAVWPISSGLYCGKKIETPTGVYKFDPSRIYSEYFSNLFIDDNGDKPNMYESLFLFSRYMDGRPTGVAIHGTYLTDRLGRQDSGGCIRLYRDNSKCLFESLTGKLDKPCIDGALTDYWGKVPSYISRNGEADPEFFGSPRKLEIGGYRVLVAIFNDSEDRL